MRDDAVNNQTQDLLKQTQENQNNHNNDDISGDLLGDIFKSISAWETREKEPDAIKLEKNIQETVQPLPQIPTSSPGLKPPQPLQTFPPPPSLLTPSSLEGPLVMGTFLPKELKEEIITDYIEPELEKCQEELKESGPNTFEYKQAYRRIEKLKGIKSHIYPEGKKNAPVDPEQVIQFITEELVQKRGEIQGDLRFIVGGLLSGQALVEANKKVEKLQKWQIELSNL